MKKTDFVLSDEKAILNRVAIMGDEKGIYFTFRTEMDAIAQVLPDPLEPAFPLVSGYIVEINKPAFAQPYREAMLGVYAKYKGQIGLYPTTFLLSGPGAEMATIGGRERFGLPKKCANQMNVFVLKKMVIV